MKTTSAVILLIICCLPATVVHGQQLSPLPGAFVDVGIGASVAGVGFTGAASASGATALNWNPAGIYSGEGAETSFSFVDQLDLVEFGRFSIAIPLKSDRSAFALSAQVSGDDALLEESASLGYAHRLGFMWLGVSGSFRRAVFGKNVLNANDYQVFSGDEVAEGIGRQVSGRASGFAVNAGLKMMLTDDMTFGVSARNIAAPLSWSSFSDARPGQNDYSESIPMEISTGVHYRLFDRLSGALEWVPELEGGAVSRIGFGAEFTPVSVFAVRAGRLIFQDGYDNEINTFGIGFSTPKSMGIRLRADYAYISGSVAKTRQVSLTLGL